MFGRSKSSHQCFIKKTVVKNFAIFTGKYLCQSLFNKVAGLHACNFIKKRHQRRGFPVNIAKFLGTPIIEKHLQTATSPCLLETIGKKISS